MAFQPGLPDLPFAPEALRAAIEATHHDGWNISDEQRAAILDELRLLTEMTYRETRVDLRTQDSARDRATWLLLGVVFTQAMEVGYRLAADSEYVKTMAKWREDDEKKHPDQAG